MTIGRKTRGTGGRCAILGSHGQTVRVGMSGTSKHFQIFFSFHMQSMKLKILNQSRGNHNLIVTLKLMVWGCYLTCMLLYDNALQYTLVIVVLHYS